MSKVWKVVSTVAIVALILGALCILAGFVTGGDVQRVKDVFLRHMTLKQDKCVKIGHGDHGS